VSDFKKSVLWSPWRRCWICWALWPRKRPAKKCAALVRYMALLRGRAGASRPTSASGSTAVFDAARQAITSSFTQLQLTRASLPRRWSYVNELAVTFRGSIRDESATVSVAPLQILIGAPPGLAGLRAARVALFQPRSTRPLQPTTARVAHGRAKNGSVLDER
jgi:hypothetical protein